MKNINHRPHTLLAAGLAVFIALPAALPPRVRAAESKLTPAEGVAKMEAARLEIAITRSNIVLTLQQLHQIQSSPDPKAQFQKFTQQLAGMEERARLTRERALAMKSKGDAYFAEWEARTAGIEDPERRRQVEASYAKRKKSYDRINMFMQQAGKDFIPMLEQLKQIKTLLEGERSQERVAAARDLFSRANWRCTDVQRSLLEVEKEFENLAADFAAEKKEAAPPRSDRSTPTGDKE